MMAPNNLQEFLKWMDATDQINIFIRERQKCRELIAQADLIVMLDFNQSNRLGEAEKYVLASGAFKVVIDHHLAPEKFCDILISDPTACSTSELVYEIISEINGEKPLPKGYSEALYVGIITDTGNFEHGNYSGRTFRTVAGLMEKGIERERILNLIYNNFSAARMRLMGYVLNQKMIVLPEFKTAYMSLSREELSDFEYIKGDTEGFVNLPLSIKGIVFSVLFIEKDGFVKLSFRSKGSFPVNEFASKFFYGGGHLNASGGEYPDTLENTVQYFLKVLKEEYGDTESIS
jgi:phosphoesterase RecJ-like protein